MFSLRSFRVWCVRGLVSVICSEFGNVLAELERELVASLADSWCREFWRFGFAFCLGRSPVWAQDGVSGKVVFVRSGKRRESVE